MFGIVESGYKSKSLEARMNGDRSRSHCSQPLPLPVARPFFLCARNRAKIENRRPRFRVEFVVCATHNMSVFASSSILGAGTATDRLCPAEEQ